MLQSGYKPYLDSEFESLIERIHPPRVTVDNDSCKDCTLVKLDSVNKHGILLEMVQVLTDLDLVISKSYICSDGGWFMDVFHVTDQLGNKITDGTLIHYIQQSLCTGRTDVNGDLQEVQPWLDRSIRTYHALCHQCTALEMTTTDRPGLLSEVSAVLLELGCQIVSAVAWTHNTRAACIFYVQDESTGEPITDPSRLAHIKDQLENVVGAHHATGENKRVSLSAPAMRRTHTERRLHQLMYADKDYERPGNDSDWSAGEESSSSSSSSGRIRKVTDSSASKISSNDRENGESTQVTIEHCEEKGYSVVNVISRDRPKLLFDTICTLTDMQFVVFHAAISSKDFLQKHQVEIGTKLIFALLFVFLVAAVVVDEEEDLLCPIKQEYYLRHMDGCTSDSEDERQRVVQSLVAAVERRVSHGLRLDVCTQDRPGLLSDITRVFREHGLSVTRAEIGMRGERAIGSFYVTDVSGREVDGKTVEMVQNEIGKTALIINDSLVWSPQRSSPSSSSPSGRADDRPNKSSLRSLLWAQLERLSGIR
ncbi:hypothetical protein Scep_001211 [Stephania cephalantha]|uniref:ACT domain-containing protein ACR n=1 Tax=Stephania cephalantha TaxID=152367 RepID=A0AAP0LAA1_9MAGN